jgi:hypothetical protein
LGGVIGASPPASERLTPTPKASGPYSEQAAHVNKTARQFLLRGSKSVEKA